MKRIFTVSILIAVTIIACTKSNKDVTPANTTPAYYQHSAARFVDTVDTVGSRFIPVSTANDMISSYLYSINSTVNDSDLRSFTINADSLRAYLANSAVRNVKFMLAHTQGWIKQGNQGVYAGYQSGAVTIIIAGYDGSGNYIYNNGQVLDNASPCPYNCPPGEAGSYLLQ